MSSQPWISSQSPIRLEIDGQELPGVKSFTIDRKLDDTTTMGMSNSANGGDPTYTVAIYTNNGTSVPYNGYPGTSGGFTYTNPPLIGTSPGFPALDFPNLRCSGGHSTDPEEVEYIDGVIVTKCSVCQERIELARVPGGISTLKLKAFLGGAMGLSLSDDTEGLSISDLLGQLADLTQEVEREEAAARRARSMLELAGAILRKKVSETTE